MAAPTSTTSIATLLMLLAACTLASSASSATATQINLSSRKLNQIQWHTVVSTSVAPGPKPIPQPNTATVITPKPVPQPTTIVVPAPKPVAHPTTTVVPAPKPVPQPLPKPTPQPVANIAAAKIVTPLLSATTNTRCNVNPVVNVAAGDWRAQMLALINEARRSHGMGPVCQSSRLNTASQAQSLAGVYGHTWNFVHGTCYNFKTLGQNIAMGQTTVAQVFNAWYNEVPPNDGHRRNILNPAFNQVGNGWSQGTNMWTQNFGYSATEPCY